MTLQVCSLLTQSEALVLQKTLVSSSGSRTVRLSNNSGSPLHVTLSTDCPYISVPSGTIEVPTIGTPPFGYDFIVTYDISSWVSDCRETAECGTITITVLDCEAAPVTLQIPVYLWNTCEVGDVQEVCGGVFPSGIWIDKNDPLTWDKIIAFLPVRDIDYSLDIGTCPHVDTYDGFVINPNENGGVFDISFDPSTFDTCGTDLLACSLQITDTKSEIPCNITVPVYITNECPDEDCPISWDATTQNIDKNDSETGTINAGITNGSDSDISVSLTTDCPYITIPTVVAVPSGMTSNVSIDYDVSEHETCGFSVCGNIVATVSYGDELECEVSLPVTITYECPIAENDNYLTSLLDDNGQPSVEISSDCKTITIVDESDWSNQGHAYDDFKDYRKITVTNLQSGTRQVLSSLGDGDVLILPAETQAQETFTLDVSEGGMYEIVLCNYPTHNSEADYQANDDVVFYDGKLYAAIQDNSGVLPYGAPSSATNWIEVTEEEAKTYSSKYCDAQKVVSYCELDQCFASKVKYVACDMNCNDLELCKNKDFLNLLKLEKLITALDLAVEENDMETATLIYDKAHQICTC